MSEIPTFEEYLASLAPFAHEVPEPDPEVVVLCERATATIGALDPLDRASLAAAVEADPHITAVLAAGIGLSQERFRTWLQAHFDTAGWVNLGRTRARELIDALDDEFSLIALLVTQASREWTWADVLARVMAPRQRAGASIQLGRDLEDAVEEHVAALNVQYQTRTRFSGKGGSTAPADFAIPSGGDALIAVAIKGFDSTGSKLTDAVREIEEMVEVRTARQFIFAVVDGQGWRRRAGDLRRIHSLLERRLIDGLYTRAYLPEFGKALHEAAKRVGLV